MSSGPSGKFILRMDPALHLKLKETARLQGFSLNEFCRAVLETAVKGTTPGGALEAVISAEFASERVQGIVLFGSAARSELTEASDIDLLIVVDSPIDRSLYRKWDESPAIQQSLLGMSHPVSPQFVRLPEGADRAGGVWLEAAVEGRILWDPDSKVHRLLVEIRRAILEGRFERQLSHGHPYWIRKNAG